MKKNIINTLKNRNLIKNISKNINKIKKINNKKIKIYCGFDPTNNSLHIGHLLILITLKRFIKKKYKIIILIGDITAKIGDPSFKKNNRKKIKNKKIKKFKKKIKKQIKKILNFNKYKIKFISNKKWFKKMNIYFFLKKICKYFKIKDILNKKFIKKRLNNNNKSINIKEILYNILQSYDYCYLFKKFKVNLQIGGSDQWGNITSGINLIKKKYNKTALGITIPLLINNKGKKFGKSKKKNIWLDKKKTKPYEFYQFWLNINDNKLPLYFKQFTLIKNKKIKKILIKNNIIKNKKILAKNITKIVHGKKQTKKAIFASKIYFNKKIKLNLKILNKLNKINIPKLKIKKKKYIYIKNILILLNISKNKSNSHNLIINKCIKINKILITDTNYIIKKKDILFNKYTIISKGKKKFFLINWK